MDDLRSDAPAWKLEKSRRTPSAGELERAVPGTVPNRRARRQDWPCPPRWATRLMTSSSRQRARQLPLRRRPAYPKLPQVLWLICRNASTFVEDRRHPIRARRGAAVPEARLVAGRA
jgi:hypothetical protein